MELTGKLFTKIYFRMIFKNVWEMSMANNYHAVSLLSTISKTFEKLLDYLLIDYLDKCGLFLISSVL